MPRYLHVFVCVALVLTYGAEAGTEEDCEKKAREMCKGGFLSRVACTAKEKAACMAAAAAQERKAACAKYAGVSGCRSNDIRRLAKCTTETQRKAKECEECVIQKRASCGKSSGGLSGALRKVCLAQAIPSCTNTGSNPRPVNDPPRRPLPPPTDDDDCIRVGRDGNLEYLCP